ncbi:DUF2487 family protein [Aquibacillus halophilus]|uniref:DUF2487 family protein n=1 Tax=Aquibacillus halophilus TaxID=930132 RepID=A0A6A8DMF2_9BACI|nr:YpiF family protein [Aquibacillus halophilus]MRH42412.1 DUF2487 family protein [Aquibacillus halophilus]
MRWQEEDIDLYIGAKEYVDTLLIPLMPLSMDDKFDINKLTVQGELLTIFANEIEKQFKGRIFLMPTYNYMFNEESSLELTRLNNWVDKIEANPFKHIFLLTLDHQWKKHERDLAGNLLWFPAIQSGNVSSKESQVIIKDQINQLSELIRSYW